RGARESPALAYLRRFGQAAGVGCERTEKLQGDHVVEHLHGSEGASAEGDRRYPKRWLHAECNGILGCPYGRRLYPGLLENGARRGGLHRRDRIQIWGDTARL